MLLWGSQGSAHLGDGGCVIRRMFSASLHQPDRPFLRNGACIAEAFDAHYRAYPALRNAEPLRGLRDEDREGTGGRRAGRAPSQRRLTPADGGAVVKEAKRSKDRHDTNRDLKQRAAPGAVPPALELRRSVPSRRLVAAGRLHLSSARAGGKEGSDKSLGGRTHRVRIAHRRHVHSSSAVRWIQREAARPMIEAAGNGPKYRPSSELADRAFMRKTSPAAMTRQPCQKGSGRPRLSRSRASPTVTEPTLTVSQTDCPGAPPHVSRAARHAAGNRGRRGSSRGALAA
jgi:hypothetical protein